MSERLRSARHVLWLLQMTCAGCAEFQVVGRADAGAGTAGESAGGAAGASAGNGGVAGVGGDGVGGNGMSGHGGTAPAIGGSAGLGAAGADGGEPQAARPVSGCDECLRAGLACEQRSEFCVECLSDADCSPEEHCATWRCTPNDICQGIQQCALPNFCPVNQGVACQECVNDGDCRDAFCAGNAVCEGQIACESFRCRWPCQGDADCGGFHCLVDQTRCVTCLTTEHCLPGFECEENICVERPIGN